MSDDHDLRLMVLGGLDGVTRCSPWAFCDVLSLYLKDISLFVFTVDGQMYGGEKDGIVTLTL